MDFDTRGPEEIAAVSDGPPARIGATLRFPTDLGLRSGADADVTAVRRLPLTLRALMLVPLLAVLADQARVTLACARGGQSCLETAGQGSLGVAGVVVLVLCALVLAVGVGRLFVGEQPMA
jgi:hypothetical protein